MSAIGEARFCAKLADMFDWIERVPRVATCLIRKGLHEGDKYVYTVVQLMENPAFG